MTRPSNDWIGKQVELQDDLEVSGHQLRNTDVIEITSVNDDNTLGGKVVYSEKPGFEVFEIPSFHDYEILESCVVLMKEERVPS